MHNKVITILGTGDYGRSLAKRLLQNRYPVVFGSRCPHNKNLGKIDRDLEDVRVLSMEQSIQASDVIFVAIPPWAFYNLEPYRHLLADKIVVDVSNTTKRKRGESNAERLAKTLPNSRVVKAFNTVSAYSMASDAAGDCREAYICGEDSNGRDIVKQIARDLGFMPMDCGGLMYARKLEAIPHKMLSGWGAPITIVTLTSIWWMFYGCLRYFYLKEHPYTQERFPLNVTNKAWGCISLTLICFCFLPGIFAAVLQMLNGTKHKRFPKWLDAWLKMRKHLGYFALLFGGLHVVQSLALLSPAYYKPWFHFSEQVVDLDDTGKTGVVIASRMSWVGETSGLLGSLGIMGMVIMGITSLPSVGRQLNWSEWRFFQSKLGWFTVLVAAGHVSVMGLGGSWIYEPFHLFGQKMSFLSCLIPWLTISLKILISLPGCTCYLNKIRNGYERGRSHKDVPVEMITASIPSRDASSQTSQRSTTSQVEGEDNLAFEAV